MIFFPLLVHLLTKTRLCKPRFPPTCCVRASPDISGSDFRAVLSLQRDTRVQTAAGKAGRGKRRWMGGGSGGSGGPCMRSATQKHQRSLPRNLPPHPQTSTTSTCTAGARRRQRRKQPTSCSTKGSFTGRHVFLKKKKKKVAESDTSQRGWTMDVSYCY